MARSGRLVVVVVLTLAVCAVGYLVCADALGLFDDDPGTGVFYTVGDDGELIEIDERAGLVSRGTGLSPEEEDALAAERAAEAAKPPFERGEGVFGVVTDGAGNPIDKARVALAEAPAQQKAWTRMPPALATALTNEKGEFLVGPAPEGVPLIVRAEAGGFAPTNEYVGRRGTRVDLVLDQGGALEVHVLDAEGEPVAGAKVMHSVGWGWNTILSDGTTSADGTVRFRAVPTGTGSLLVVAGGHAAARIENVAVAPRETETRTVVLDDSHQLAGRVVDARTEAPVEGAKITVHYPTLPVLEPTTGGATDADGGFTVLADVTIGEQVEIRVGHDAYAEARLTHQLQERNDLVVKMQEPGEPIEGVVLGPDRHAVAGATVTWFGLPEGDVIEATSGSDGRFELARPGWFVKNGNIVAVSAVHGTALMNVTFPTPGGPRPAPIEILLPGAGQIEGTVTGRDGNPIEGALVSLAVDHQETRSRLGGQVNPWLINTLLANRSLFNLTTVSDAAGRFLLEGVPSLAYRVTAKFGLDQARTEEPVLVERGSTARADIALKAGGTIEGFVLDAEEKPVAGAYVRAWPQDPRAQGWNLPQPYGRTQSDGHFVLRGIEDHDHTVSVYARGYGSASEQHVRSGEAELRMTVVKLGWIEGTVEAADGAPYRGTFLVHAKRKQGGNRGRNRWYGGNQAHTFNTDDGAFEVRGLTEGEYTVRTSTRSGLISIQEETVRVSNGRATRELTLRLIEGAVLRGHVVSEADGKPLRNAYVYVSARPGEAGMDNSGATSGNCRSDAKGAYEIKGLGAGAYSVNVWYDNQNWSVAVDLQAGEQRQLDLARQQPGSIEITIVDEAGKPVEGAWANVKNAAGQWVNPNWQLMQRDQLVGSGPNAWNEATRTNAEGLVVRYHVPPGRYEISGNMGGYQAQGEAPWIEVAAASTTSITVVIKKP